VVVCAGVIHDARDVAKVHNFRIDPFSSADDGPIGYVEDGKLRLVREFPPAGKPRAISAAWPQVEIVLSHAGANGETVRLLADQGVKGIVVATTGNGSVHRDLMPALLEARTKGVKVLRATRCAEGGIIARPGDELPHTQLSPVKARIRLMLELAESAGSA